MADVAGDHCYLTLAARAEARLSMALDDQAAAESWLKRGLDTTPWYLWYRARLLDTAAEVAIDAGSPAAGDYADRLGTMATAAPCANSWSGRTRTGRSWAMPPPRRPSRGWPRTSTTRRSTRTWPTAASSDQLRRGLWRRAAGAKKHC